MCRLNTHVIGLQHRQHSHILGCSSFPSDMLGLGDAICSKSILEELFELVLGQAGRCTCLFLSWVDPLGAGFVREDPNGQFFFHLGLPVGDTLSSQACVRLSFILVLPVSVLLRFSLHVLWISVRPFVGKDTAS
jgi:hypothetical protein